MGKLICHTALLSVLLPVHHVITAHHTACIHILEGFVRLVLLCRKTPNRITAAATLLRSHIQNAGDKILIPTPSIQITRSCSCCDTQITLRSNYWGDHISGSACREDRQGYFCQMADWVQRQSELCFQTGVWRWGCFIRLLICLVQCLTAVAKNIEWNNGLLILSLYRSSTSHLLSNYESLYGLSVSFNSLSLC